MELDPPMSIKVHIETKSMKTCSRATRAFIEHVETWIKENV